jgi:hypothetical protein
VADATPLHAARLLPPSGKGVCGISAGWKRRAASYENENSLQKSALVRDRRGIHEGRRSFVPTRTTKIPICRCFTGLEPASSGVKGRSCRFGLGGMGGDYRRERAFRPRLS